MYHAQYTYIHKYIIHRYHTYNYIIHLHYTHPIHTRTYIHMHMNAHTETHKCQRLCYITQERMFHVVEHQFPQQNILI